MPETVSASCGGDHDLTPTIYYPGLLGPGLMRYCLRPGCYYRMHATKIGDPPTVCDPPGAHVFVEQSGSCDCGGITWAPPPTPETHA